MIAAEEAGHGKAERTVVIERAGHELGAADFLLEARDQRIEGAVVVGDDDLGTARGAAGRRRFPEACGLLGQFGVGECRVGFIADIDAGDLAMGTGRGPDDERGSSDLDDHFAFGNRQARGNRLRRRAEFPCCEAGFVEGDAVGQADGDEVAFLDAERGIGAGEAIGVRLERRPCDAPPFMGDGGAVWLLRRPVSGDAPDWHDGHGLSPSIFMGAFIAQSRGRWSRTDRFSVGRRIRACGSHA